MKVSVIIPLFNQEQSVERAVRSALQQTETAEVIVIDDGSQDLGSERVRKILAEDERLKIVEHENGQRFGVSMTRNYGARLAQYPYLAFLDADDYFLPDRFAETKKVFENNPDAEAVCEALGAEAADHVTMLSKPIESDRLFFEMEPFGKSGYFWVCALTVKAHVFRETGGFSELLESAEDTEWLARLVLNHRVMHGKLNKCVAMRGKPDGRVRDSKKVLENKTLMVASLIKWAAKEPKSAEVLTVLTDLYLKYHYEENRLFSKRSRWSKKRIDFEALLFLLKTNRRFINLPKVRYFAKTVLGLPVKRHLDYYHPSAEE